MDLDFHAVNAGLSTPLADPHLKSKFRLAVHERHPRLASLRFLPDGVIEIALAKHYPSWTSPTFLAARLIGSRLFFAKLRQLCPDLIGECDLWLADVPECPGLAFSGSNLSNVLIPDPHFLESDAYADLRNDTWVPWLQRNDRVFWRGTLSGDFERRFSGWRSYPRAALCLRLAEPQLLRRFDVRLIAQPSQLQDEAQIGEMRQFGLFANPVPLRRFAEYRSAIDIDGNSCAWMGLFSKLLMGNAVLKVDSPRGHRQWLYDKLVPWLNFIPIAGDFRNLLDAAEWMRRTPKDAEAIANRGKMLAASMTLDQVMLDVAPKVIAYIRAVTRSL